jgi:CHASE3 domain sensor protein
MYRLSKDRYGQRIGMGFALVLGLVILAFISSFYFLIESNKRKEGFATLLSQHLTQSVQVQLEPSL